MTGNTKICRICLISVDNDNYIDLDDAKQEMFKIVLPLSDVLLNTKSVLCNNCSESLQQSFDFKTTCLNNEVHLKTFRPDNGKTILAEIIPKGKTTEDVVKKESGSICRLCFKYFDSHSFTDLSRIEDDFFLGNMIEKCLPEIDLNSVDHPLMCHNCLQSLQNHFNVISTLLDTNDKINDYISYKNTNNNVVDLRDVLEFTMDAKRGDKKDTAHVKVKEEEEAEMFEDMGPSEIHIKMEEDLFLKEEREYAPVDGTASTDGPSPTEQTERDVHATPPNLTRNSQGLYACPYCPHETTRKDSLQLHLVVHSNGPRFKCDKCHFVTKWRTSLYQHAWLHKEATLYQCPLCPYSSRYSKHVRRHSKQHGESPYPTSFRCQHCSFTTEDKKCLKLHSRSLHEQGVIFRCVQCDFTSHKECLLTQHCNKEHRRYVCDDCGFRAGSLWHLKDHKLKHAEAEEVKMLRCARCEFRTKYKNSLRAHLRRHDSGRREAAE